MARAKDFVVVESAEQRGSWKVLAIMESGFLVGLECPREEGGREYCEQRAAWMRERRDRINIV